ncbi:uncharacterized protein LOC106707958 isoform X1 [Papilio machaon]|uniref:uncharacterized protein LOC106707958 isoform X1 n=1 Tax=Papilio machaon TaxID=76193 RepID=UPI001E664B40|nr:uncharacterized protein LOC106707958 isoform X1 [Papilio machaon]
MQSPLCLRVGLVLVFGVLIDITQPLCVLESDFGFKINCAFKKSGLFRVRNLGGIKAHASLGFSLGDELGFEQSLTNLDTSRRRSVSFKNGAPNVIVDSSNRTPAKQEKRGKQNRIMMRPVSSAARPNQAAMDKLSSLHRRVSSTMQPIVVPTIASPNTMTMAKPTITLAKPMPMGVPPFRPLPPKEDTLKVLPIASTQAYSPLAAPQSKGPGLAYPSENTHSSQDNISKMVSHMTAIQYGQPFLSSITPTPLINTRIYTAPTPVNPFVPMPVAAPPTQAISVVPAPGFHNSQFPSDTNSNSFRKTINPFSNFVDPQTQEASQYPNTKKVDDYNTISGYGDDTALKFSKEDINEKIAEIAKAGNISMEAVEAAIALRQQQLLNKYANIPIPTTPSTSTTTTEDLPVFQTQPEPEIVVASVQQKPKRNPTTGKVMNAPREYYPVGYEKNFDDHFQSKVDLPETNFHCGDQKYFPGLYGDESLGCMVFHVCALTDDGLVMKSFLCPESTLFDQTILKCNWWFYVDCKNTARLYDTNIPVSKSYQLMKALTFFSSYKKEMQDGNSMNPEDVDGIKEAITILENQDSKTAQSNVAESIQIVTPQSIIIDERNNHRTQYSDTTSPVYRGTREFSNSTERRNARRNATNSQETKDDDFKLITVNANMNYTKPSGFTLTENSPKNSAESTERKYRRRMTLRYSPTTKETTTTFKPLELTTFTSSLVEIMKQEIQPMENFNSQVKQEKLTDQIDKTIVNESETHSPVKRFYRSSAESYKDEQEFEIVDDKKVQIVRPTTSAQLVGQNPTPTAAIAKLDEAVLGSSIQRLQKHTTTVVSEKAGDFLSPDRPGT